MVFPALRLVVWCRHLLCLYFFSYLETLRVMKAGVSSLHTTAEERPFYESLLVDSFKYPERSSHLVCHHFLQKSFHVLFS